MLLAGSGSVAAAANEKNAGERSEPVAARNIPQRAGFRRKGDGKTDDTKAIQKALDSAAGTQGTVFVPEGAYMCGELQNVSRHGALRLPGVELSQQPGRCDSPERQRRELPAEPHRGVRRNGQWNLPAWRQLGGERPIHGIMIDKPDYGSQEDTPRIDGCRVEQFTGDGIRLERIWCFSVRHSHSVHNGGCGLRVRGWDGFILDNWFSGNGDGGFRGL